MDLEQRFQLIAETINDVCWIANPNFSQLAYISPSYERVWGRSNDELRRNPRSLLESIHADDRTRIEHHLDHERDGRSFDHEYRIIHTDGSVRWIRERGHSVRTSSGAIECYVGAAQDITEHKGLAAERDAVVERFQFMSRAMNEGMWDWHIPTNQAWWSDSIYTVFGLTPAMIASFEGWGARVHPDDRDRVVAGFRRVVENAEPTWSDEYRFVRPDGRVLDVFDRGFAIFDEHGKPMRMVGVVMDITQQKALERQLRHAQKMEAVGQLAGGIAHDFNNVLQAVALELAMVQATPGTTPKLLAHLREIRSALDRASGLTRQLLVFSRREAMRPRRIDLNAQVAELGRMLRRVLTADIELDVELATGAIPAEVDPSMLDQVLMNLAVNARDSMRTGGRLSIKTSLHDRREPRGQARPGRYACLAVTDTGVGIPAETLPRIFEPFFTTKQLHGTGLGLATVHGIVEQHGGWVEVESEVGRGTTFRVFLPMLDGAVTLVADEVPAPRSSGHERILVVEDDPAVRRGLSALLQSQGYDVVTAESGSVAIETWEAREGRIDLVLTDLVMPGGINGRDLALHLIARRPELKVILASGYGPELDIGTLPRNFEVIHKPIDGDRLLDIVRLSLDRTDL